MNTPLNTTTAVNIQVFNTPTIPPLTTPGVIALPVISNIMTPTVGTTVPLQSSSLINVNSAFINNETTATNLTNNLEHTPISQQPILPVSEQIVVGLPPLQNTNILDISTNAQVHSDATTAPQITAVPIGNPVNPYMQNANTFAPVPFSNYAGIPAHSNVNAGSNPYSMASITNALPTSNVTKYPAANLVFDPALAAKSANDLLGKYLSFFHINFY